MPSVFVSSELTLLEQVLPSEIVPGDFEALDRITAEPVFAKISSPHYHASAMDGICVRAEDTFGATEFVGKTLTLADGDAPAAGSFKYVDTGNALPAWANAVIMIEKVHQLDKDTLEIFDSAAPWQHVRLVGEDVVATEMLLPRAHRLRPYDLGALLAAALLVAAALSGVQRYVLQRTGEIAASLKPSVSAGSPKRAVARASYRQRKMIPSASKRLSRGR